RTQALELGAHRNRLHNVPVDINLVGRGNRDEDAGGLRSDGRHRLRLRDLDARLLDEYRGDDEEDEHDEHDVEHRRQVDFALFLVEVGLAVVHALRLLWCLAAISRDPRPGKYYRRPPSATSPSPRPACSSSSS